MGDLSEAVRQLIVQHISSVDQLEILLLLKENSARVWTVEDVSQALLTQPEVTATRLSELAHDGLLSVKNVCGKDLYRYHARTAQLEPAVAELARLYPQYRVRIISLIYSKPTDKIRTFADAFRLRKEEDEK